MSNDQADLKEQLAAAKREIEALRRENERVRAERKELADIMFADLDAQAPTEEEVAASLKDRKPLRPFLESLGVYPAPEGAK